MKIIYKRIITQNIKTVTFHTSSVCETNSHFLIERWSWDLEKSIFEEGPGNDDHFANHSRLLSICDRKSIWSSINIPQHHPPTTITHFFLLQFINTARISFQQRTNHNQVFRHSVALPFLALNCSWWSNYLIKYGRKTPKFKWSYQTSHTSQLLR